MTSGFRTAVLVAFSLAIGNTAMAQPRTTHALDPLSAAEITRAATVLRAEGRLSDQARFGTIVVNPPEKSAVGARAARVIGFDWTRHEGFLAIVDLVASRVQSYTVIDSEPPMRLLTIRRAEEAAHADPRWVAAMKSRGIDTARVSVLVRLGERAKLPRKGEDRVVDAGVWLRDGVPDALTVEGMTLNVNLTRGRLDGFINPPTPTVVKDSSALKALTNPRRALLPLSITQPQGTSVRIVGNEVTWDRWRLRVGIDPRRGLEVHDVSFRDGARQRSVLYSGSVSEIVAPYGDPAFGTWYPRDEGDYGMGLYGLTSAVAYNDAPANAVFLPATMHDQMGRPIVVPRSIVVYERDGGLLWRHANLARRARQLVVSTHATIDNYDYQFNWIFAQDGTIESEVALTGIMNVNPTALQLDTAHADGHTQTGHLVAPGVNAPNHQHFFSYRLDLDVDGAANSIYTMESRSADSSATNTKGETIEMTERAIGSESAATMDVSFAAARSWRVANTHERNALGQFTGYTLVPGAATPSFSTEWSVPRKASGYIGHQFWATPHATDELYAAGEFQNLGREGDGLPRWTSANRPLLDTDVVLWYTLGITHIPRPEDWPYMPIHRGGFRLVPTSFFARNPTLDVPAGKR